MMNFYEVYSKPHPVLKRIFFHALLPHLRHILGGTLRRLPAMSLPTALLLTLEEELLNHKQSSDTEADTEEDNGSTQ
jgi:hypothetical protein